MPAKLRVALIIGGKSAEHEVSIHSGRNVYNALDREKYEIVLIGIDHQGVWHRLNERKFSSGEDSLEKLSLESPLLLTLGESQPGARAELISLRGKKSLGSLDLAFPVLHGPCGEDGTLQGLLQLAGLPFVGAGVLGSAIGMDKDVMKRLFREAQLPTPDFLVLHRNAVRQPDARGILKRLGPICFVKPANLGSSVAISRVADEKKLLEAMELAWQYDEKILVEKGIEGREIECAVLGNEKPEASVPGEIIASGRHSFYTYDAKYIDPEGAELKAPADLPAETVKRVQALAVRAFQVLCCQGMARVDMFLKADGELLLNEINTIPGFTNISMYPRLWERSGLATPGLIDRLIELALEQDARKKALKSV